MRPAVVRAAVLLVAAAIVAAIAAHGSVARRGGTEPICRAELRSWIVLGRARHLYLQLECPPPVDSCSGRVEFTWVMLRPDYRYTSDESGMPRLGRMIGGTLRPPWFAPPPDDRLEAVYTLTAAQARLLARDRVFTSPYTLLGVNSNSGIRRALADAGLSLPPHVLASGGPMGEFPGVEFDPGPDLPREDRPRFGLIVMEPPRFGPQ